MFLRYSVSLLGYGFYGDVLSDSERKRWMGPARYDFSGGKNIISFNFIYNVLQIKQRNLLMSDLSERPGTLNISKERLFLCHRSVTSAYHSPSSHFHLLARVHYS